MSRRLAEALQGSTAQFRVTQLCNVLQDAVMNGDQQNRMAMIKKLLEVDLNDEEIDQPLLIFEILLQTLAMPKAVDLDCGNRAEIASHACRFLTIFFARCGATVTVSKEFKASASDRVQQLLAVSNANIRTQPESAFQFHMKRIDLTLRSIMDSTASPYPNVALSLIEAAATLSLSNLADAAIGALKVIGADLVDRAVQMLEGELLSRLVALDFIRVAPNLVKVSEVLDEKGGDAGIEVPEFDVDDFIERLCGMLDGAVSFHWMEGYLIMDSLLSLCKLGMSVQRVSLVLFGNREGHFDPESQAGIAPYCLHGQGFFDSINPLSNNWRIREKAVNCLIVAHKQTKNKALKGSIASILTDRRMLEKDERVSLVLNRPDLVTEFNELLKKDWQERSDVYLSAIGDLNAKISQMMAKAEQTSNDDQRAETQQQISEAREYLQALMNRMGSVSKELGKLDTINDKLTEFRDEHAKQWQKFEARFGAEIERLERRREADQAAVMGKLDQIHQLMSAMQAGGGSHAEPVLQLDDIVAKLKAQYMVQELDMVMTKDRIPLDKIFIQLAVVESNIGGKLTEDTKRHAVPLPQMFRERKKRAVKKILIVGKAGVGKTTLCKKFTFDWATGALWPQFRFVFILKFRNVNRQRYAQPDEQHLAHALVREQLSDRGVEHTSALLTAVRDILKNHLEETLILCDGYDESTDTPPTIIEDLFRCPNVIFTSRPYGIEQIVNRFDLHIENIGFTPVHIKEYVRMFFDALQGGDEGLAGAKALVAFLDTNPNILVMSTVPVNLQLVCSLFLRQRDIFSTGHISIGCLYNKLVEYLIEGYFERESVQNPAAMDAVVRRVCGKIAFQGINNSHIVLPNKLLQSAVMNEPLFEQNILNVFRVGLIKPAIEGKHVPLWKQDGYFLHLTFQEYFAATWLAGHMSTEERHEWLREKKFTPRLILTVCFTISILAIEGRDAEVVDAFRAIMATPVDEAKLVQSLLVLQALDELSVPLIRAVEKKTSAVSFAMELIRNVLRRGESDAVGHIAEFMERTSLIASAPEIAASLDSVLSDPQSADAASRVLLAMGKYYPTHAVTLRASIASLGLLRHTTSEKEMRGIVASAVSSGRMERFVRLMRQHHDDVAMLDFVLKNAKETPLLLLGLMKPMLVGSSVHRDTRAYQLIHDAFRRNTRIISERHVLYNKDEDYFARFEFRAGGNDGVDPYVNDRREWTHPGVEVRRVDLMHHVITREVMDAFGRETAAELHLPLLGIVAPADVMDALRPIWDAVGTSSPLGIDEVLIRLHFEHFFGAGSSSFVASCIASRLEQYTASEALKQYWSFFVHHDEVSASWKCVERVFPVPLLEWVQDTLATKVAMLAPTARAPASRIAELSADFTTRRTVTEAGAEGTCDEALLPNLHVQSHLLRQALVETRGIVDALVALDTLCKSAASENQAQALRYQQWIVWTMDERACSASATLLSTTLEALHQQFGFCNHNVTEVSARGDPHAELDADLRLLRSTDDAAEALKALMHLPAARHTDATRHKLFQVFYAMWRKYDPRVTDGMLDERVMDKLKGHPKYARMKMMLRGWQSHLKDKEAAAAGAEGAYTAVVDSHCGRPRNHQRHWSHQVLRIPWRFLLRVASMRERYLPVLLDIALHRNYTNVVMQILFQNAQVFEDPEEARAIMLRIREIVTRMSGFTAGGGKDYLHKEAFLLYHRFADNPRVVEALCVAHQAAVPPALSALVAEISPPLAVDPDTVSASVHYFTNLVEEFSKRPMSDVEEQLKAAMMANDSLAATAFATAAIRHMSPSQAPSAAIETPIAAFSLIRVCGTLFQNRPNEHDALKKAYNQFLTESVASHQSRHTTDTAADDLGPVASLAVGEFRVEDEGDDAQVNAVEGSPEKPAADGDDSVIELYADGVEKERSVPRPMISESLLAAQPTPASQESMHAIAYRLVTKQPTADRYNSLDPAELFAELLIEFSASEALVKKFVELRGASVRQPPNALGGGGGAKRGKGKKAGGPRKAEGDDGDHDGGSVPLKFVELRVDVVALPDACFDVLASELINGSVGAQRFMHHFAMVNNDSSNDFMQRFLSRAVVCGGAERLVLAASMGQHDARRANTRAVLNCLRAFGYAAQGGKRMWLTRAHVPDVYEAASRCGGWRLLLLLSPECFHQTPLTVRRTTVVMGGDEADRVTLRDGLVCLDYAPNLVCDWWSTVPNGLFLHLLPAACTGEVAGADRDLPPYFYDGRAIPYVIRRIYHMAQGDLDDPQREALRENLSSCGFLVTCRQIISGSTSAPNDKGGKRPPSVAASMRLLWSADDADWGGDWLSSFGASQSLPLPAGDDASGVFSLLSDRVGLTALIPRFAVMARQCATQLSHVAFDFVAGVESVRAHVVKGIVYKRTGASDTRKAPPVTDDDSDTNDEIEDQDTDVFHPDVLLNDDHFYSVSLVECFCKAFGLHLCDKCMTLVKTPGNPIQHVVMTRFAAADVLPALFTKTCNSCIAQLSQLLANSSGSDHEPSFAVFERFLEMWSMQDRPVLYRIISTYVEQLKTALRARRDRSSTLKTLRHLAQVLDDGSIAVEGNSANERVQQWKLWYLNVMTMPNQRGESIAPPTSEVDYKETFFSAFDLADLKPAKVCEALATLAAAHDPKLDHMLHFLLSGSTQGVRWYPSEWIASALQAHNIQVAHYLVERIIRISPSAAYQGIANLLEGLQRLDGESVSGPSSAGGGQRAPLSYEDIPLPSGDGLPLDLPTETIERIQTESAMFLNLAVERGKEVATHVRGINEIRAFSNPPRDIVNLMLVVAGILDQKTFSTWAEAKPTIFADTRRFVLRLQSADAIADGLAQPGIQAMVQKFEPLCHEKYLSISFVCGPLANWLHCVKSYCTSAKALLSARKKAMDAACVEPLRLRFLKATLHRMIDLPPSEILLPYIQNPANEPTILAAETATETLQSAVQGFIQRSSSWKRLLAGALEPPAPIFRLLSVLARLLSGTVRKSWVSTQVFLRGKGRGSMKEVLSAYAVGQYYSESTAAFLDEQLASEQWRTDVECSASEDVVPALDVLLRTISAYWKSSMPIYAFQAEGINLLDAKRVEWNEKRKSAVNTLTYSMWVWSHAEEDFRQSQMNMFPIRTVLTAVAKARKSADAFQETWLMQAATTICRSQQRALICDAKDPAVFVFTEDNAITEFVADLS